MSKPTDEDVMRWASLGLSNGLRDDMAEPREWLAGVKAEAFHEGMVAYREHPVGKIGAHPDPENPYGAVPASHDTDRSPE